MRQRSSQPRKGIGKETISSVAVSQKELELSILEVMKKHAAKKGLTNS